MRSIPLHTTCVLSERWPVEPFHGQFPDPVFKSEIVAYQVSFNYRRYSIIDENNFTVISIEHNYFTEMGDEDFANWGRGAGGAEIARHIVYLVNRLIDIVQTTFKETDSNPFPHLRHIGIRDFVELDSLYSDKYSNLISYSMLGLDGRFAKRTFGIVSKVNFSTEDDTPKEKNKIIRAVELLNSGYHSEAVLVSFSILDNTVQEVLKILMEERGVVGAKNKIREVKSARLTNYLGRMLKEQTDHSLEEENLELWNNLVTCNRIRNDVIHQSEDIKYDRAKLCIETVRDIFFYLSSIPRRDPVRGPFEPVVHDLHLQKLPFLLEY